MTEEKKNIPKLRFPEFKNAPAWEQRKLGDISEICGGGTPSTNVDEYWNGHINWFSPNEIGGAIYLDKSKKTITNLGLSKSSARMLPVGTVLFTSRAGIGNTAILGVEACTNQGFQSIIPNKNELCSYFIFTMTPLLKQYAEKLGSGSTFIEISGKQMEKIEIYLPNYLEQLQISSLFKNIDTHIACQQRMLEHLKLRKKALLQQMFV